jgi:hypothetical protein
MTKRRFVLAAGLLLACAGRHAPDPFRFAGAPCVTPPRLHCPDADCPSDRVINEGNVVEMKTRRTYFLDYPCDMKPGEPVTFIPRCTAPVHVGTGSAITFR